MPTFMRLHQLGIASAIAAVVCGLSSRRANADEPRPARPPADVSAPAISEEECRRFAGSVIKAVDDADQAALNRLIDEKAILETMAAGLNIREQVRADLYAGIEKSLAEAGGILVQVVQDSKKGGSFTLLRIRHAHGRQVLLFRLIHSDSSSGLNYLELVPRRERDGQIRVVDIYTFLAGEFVSASMRRAILPLVAEQSRSALSKLVLGEQDYVLDVRRIQEGNRLLKQGKPAEALEIYKSLRPGTRKQKNILLCQMRAAQEANDDREYAAVIDEIQRTFPGDPCVDFISIDGLLMRKEYNKAMEAVDRVDRSLGGDPYLNTLRAGICESRGDREGARRFIRRAIAEEPTLLDAHWSLVGLALEDKDHKGTLDALEEIHRRFALEFGDLTRLPEYADFVKSPQYREWLDYLSKHRSPRPPEGPGAKVPTSKPTTPAATSENAPRKPAATTPR